MENQKVWLPDPVDGYVLGIIEDIHQDSVTAKTLRHPQKVGPVVLRDLSREKRGMLAVVPGVKSQCLLQSAKRRLISRNEKRVHP